MKRKLTLLVCVILAVMMMFTLASCNNKNKDDHTHTFSAEWSSNDVAHWRESACGHADVKADYSAHVDADNDAKCDICAKCDHNLSADWSSDATHHWNASTCNDHKEYKGNLEAHVDANNDAKCDVCKYCSHSYSSEWTNDVTGHWHEANCGCIGLEVQDFTAHVDDVLDGVCDVCQYVVCTHADEDGDGACDNCTYVMDKFLNAIGKLNAEAEKSLNSAKVNSKTESYSEYGEYIAEALANTKYYDNYATYVYDDTTYYCSYYGNNALYVIGVDADGNASRNEYVTEYPVGAKVTYNTVGLYVYNIEALVAGLYEIATAEQTGNNLVLAFVTNYNDETGVASFSYFYYEEYEEFNWDGSSSVVENAYVVNVEFTLDQTTNGILTATVEVTNYDIESVTFDAEADTYEVAEDATKKAYSEYVVEQTFGDAFDSTDAPNPYPAEGNVVTDDFTLEARDEEGNVTATYEDEATIKFTVGESIILYFDAETEKVITFSTVDVSNDGNFSLMCSTVWGDPKKSIEFSSYAAGEYTCTITVEGEYVLNLNVVVEYRDTTSLDAGVADKWGNIQEADTLTTYAGSENVIGVVVGSYENPYTTYEVVEGNKDNLVIVADGKSWTVKATAVGTYVIKLTSVSNEELSDTIEIVANEAPSISDILNGTYEGSNMYSGLDISVSFNPSEEGATSGYVVVTIEGQKFDYNTYEWTTISFATTYDYAYDENNGIALTYSSGDELEMFEIALVNYEVVVYYDSYDYNLEIPGEEEEEETTTLELGDNTLEVTGDNQDMTMVTITATQAGTYSFTPGTDAVIEYGDIFKIDGEALEIEVVAGDTITIGVNNMYGQAGYVVITVAFEAAEGGEEGGTDENDNAELNGTWQYIDLGEVYFQFVFENGTITPTDFTNGNFQFNESYTYEYDKVQGVITVDGNDTTMFTLDRGGNLVYGFRYTLTKQASSDDNQTKQDGTMEFPYIISATGDYTCEFPGGYDVVWYTYTLTEGGYVTISTTFTGEGWLKLGANPMTAKENGGTGAALTEYFPAGTVVYLGAGDWDEGADQVPFNVAFEAFTSESCENIAGTWTGTESTRFGANVAYTLTINADGTGTLVYDEGWGETTATVSYILVKGEDVVVAYETQYSSGKLTCTYADGTFTCTAGMYSATFVWEKAE